MNDLNRLKKKLLSTHNNSPFKKIEPFSENTRVIQKVTDVLAYRGSGRG
jgi:hypothetical protein